MRDHSCECSSPRELIFDGVEELKYLLPVTSYKSDSSPLPSPGWSWRLPHSPSPSRFSPSAPPLFPPRIQFSTSPSLLPFSTQHHLLLFASINNNTHILCFTRLSLFRRDCSLFFIFRSCSLVFATSSSGCALACSRLLRQIHHSWTLHRPAISIIILFNLLYFGTPLSLIVDSGALSVTGSR